VEIIGVYQVCDGLRNICLLHKYLFFERLIFLQCKGNELCLLSEGVSALPHTPAPSLMTAGVLPQLLLDPHAAPLDYINVAAVIRSKEDNSHSRHNSEKNIKGVQNALQSFRVVTSDT
jgi:hypothetical protein